MFADLIDHAPLLTARDLQEFKQFVTLDRLPKQQLRCFSFATTGTQCVKLAVDFGDEWLDWFRTCHVLVEGDFRFVSGCTHPNSSTLNVYPMPLEPTFPMQFRRKSVFAVFAVGLEHVYNYGTHRIGEWVVSPSSPRLSFLPKDYVFDAHLDVNVYDSDPGCNCCVDLEFSEAETSMRRHQDRQHLEFFVRNVNSDEKLAVILNTHSVDVIDRLLEVFTKEFQQLPYHSESMSMYRANKLAALRKHVSWRRRRDLLFCSSKEPVVPKLTGTDLLLGDSRLYGRTVLNRVRSLYIGAVLSFL